MAESLRAQWRTALEQMIAKRWYGSAGVLRLLTPFEMLYQRISANRRRSAAQQELSLRVPTIVVGNLVAGGTGKTPVVAAVVRQLQALGARPGIIVRGFGGSSTQWPRLVTPRSDPLLCGDEGVELAQLTGVPVMAGSDRNASIRWLHELLQCDVVVSDDGLQHYAMPRDAELVLVDAVRRFGNGRHIPVGPLREAPGRAASADLILLMAGDENLARAALPDVIETAGLEDSEVEVGTLQAASLQKLTGGEALPIQRWREQVTNRSEPVDADCIALSGIANPAGFQSDLKTLGLREAGLNLRAVTYADHHAYKDFQPGWRPQDLVITTGKDAVKLRALLNRTKPVSTLWQNVWVLERRVNLSPGAESALRALLVRLLQDKPASNSGAVFK